MTSPTTRRPPRTVADKMLAAMLVASAGVATSAALGTPAIAQEARTYAIPAGELTDVLNRFARQAGVELAYNAALTDGIASNGLSGSFGVVDGLSRILSGTGITYRQTGPRAFTLERAPQASGDAIRLDTLRVEGTTGGAGNGTEASGAPENRPYRTPGSSAYITRQDIERFRGTSPADIFQGTPGVISGEARNSGAIDVNIRGLQGYNRTTVTIDGAQQTSSIDRGYYGDANRTFIDPDLLSSVSITKGPSNSPSSSGAIAGEVAMTTLTASDVVRPGRTFGVRLRLGTSTNNAAPPPTGTVGGIGNHGGLYLTATNRPDLAVETVPADFGDTPAEGRPGWLEPNGWNGSLAVAAKRDDLELVAAIARRKTGNYFAGTRGNHARIGQMYSSEQSYPATEAMIARMDRLSPGHGFKVGDILTATRESYGNIGSTFYRAGEEVLNTSNAMTSGLLKGSVRFGDGHRLELGYSRSVSKFGYQFPSSIKFASDSLISQLDLARADAEMGTAKYSFDPADNDLVDLTLNAWMTGQSIEETMRTRGSSEIRTIDNYSRVAGFDLSNRSVFFPAGGELSVRYGVAYLKQRMRSHSDSQWPGQAGALVLHNISENISRRRQFDAFVDGRWTPVGWLTIDAGLRYLDARTESGGRLLYSSNSPYPADSETRIRSAKSLVPNVGITVEPLDGLQIYGTYKEGWRAPSFTEMSDFIVGGTPYSYEGPVNQADLKDEKSRNLEFGVNFLRQDLLKAGDSLGVKLNYFSNTISDYIMLVLVNFPYDAGGTIITASGASAINYDRARFSGFEGSMRYDSGLFFAEAAATYYDRVRFCLTDTLCRDWGLDEGITTNAWRNHIPPEYAFSATLGLRLFDRRLTLAARVSRTAASKMKTLHMYEATSQYVTNLSWDRYTLVDLSGAFQVTDALQFELSAQNLFDKYHVDPLAMAMQPAPGRTVRLNATLNF